MLDQKLMSSIRGRSLLILVGLLFLGCNSPSGTTSSVPDNAKKSGNERTSDLKPVIDSDWTQAEWLQAADGFSAKPETMPRLNSPTAPIFDKLITTKAWIDHDWHIFESNEPPNLLRFFPTIKKLTVTLMSLGAVDEMIALGLYNMVVFDAFIKSGTDFIAHLPSTDTTKNTREAGIDKVRLGSAIGVCGLLYLVMNGSEKYQAIAFKRLSQPDSYSFHSRESLQLILATLDERLIKSGPSSLRTQYQSVRSVVAMEHGKRSDSKLSRVTYQGLGPPALDVSTLVTMVSVAGKFSVDIGPAGLASSVEFSRPDGSTLVQHRIELQEGSIRFEAACLSGQTEEGLTTQFMTIGLVPQESQYSGRWLAMNRAGNDVRMRILSISGQGCVASVEAPSGQVPATRIESFLASLRATP